MSIDPDLVAHYRKYRPEARLKKIAEREAAVANREERIAAAARQIVAFTTSNADDRNTIAELRAASEPLT